MSPRALRRRKRRAKERGIALIMVLGAIAVLTVMLAEMQDSTGAELASAMADRDSTQAEYMARSAVNLGRLLIASEPTIRMAIAPLFMLMKRQPPQLTVWEFSDRILGVFNDQGGTQEFQGTTGLDPALGKNLGMPGGRWELVIVDEDAKINVNLGASNDIAHIRLAKELMGLMAPPALNPLFEQRDVNGAYHDRMETCAAIIDWADVDELKFSCDVATSSAPPANAPEDAYYQLLPTKPYRRKNAPYDSLDELHLVRGVGDDFWATLVDPEPTNPKKRNMTVWGQGAVNINSATPQTLLALTCAGAVPQTEICTDPAQMQLFLTAFMMARGISMGAPMFGSPGDFVSMMKGQGMIGPMLTAMGIKPVKFQSESEFAKSLTTESKMFSIYAVGVVKGYKRETRLSIHTVVDFRNAPPITGGLPGAPGTPGALPPGTPGAPPPGTVPGQVPGALPPGATQDAFGAALQPSTGGTVVYWKME
jgi:general secretion pathway protein K